MINSTSANRSIPDDIWGEYFVGPDGKFIGESFENLSIDLLEEFFSPGWKKTKKSHDGNKDFVLNFSSNTYWAESKSYKDPISYHVVTPTLFMAMLGDPKAIIFLSRSPFKNTAKPLFSRYQTKTGKAILCFDGPLLDELIGRSERILNKYFPGFSYQHRSRGGIGCRTHVTSDVSRLPMSHEDELPESPKILEDLATLTIGLGELIRIDAVLVNENASEPMSINVGFEAVDSSPIGNILEIVRSTETSRTWENGLLLQPGEVRHISILLRGATPSNIVSLPALVVRRGTDEVTRSRLCNVEVSRLYRIDMVGASHVAARNAIIQHAQSSRRHRIFQVLGRSGTGKSRLLQDIGTTLVAEGYHVHRYDKEFSRPETSDLVLRGLLAGLNRLPLISTELDRPDDLDSETGNYGEDDTQLLARMIYQEKSDLRKNPILLAKAICRSVRSRKTALVLDNVQNLDDTFVATIDEMVSRLMLDEADPPAIVVLAFNEDLLVRGSPAEMLAHRLKLHARTDDAESRIHGFQLSALLPDDVKAFVESALLNRSGGSFDLDLYPLSREAFYEHVPRTPLHIWETLRFLRDKGALRLENDLLVVQDEQDSNLAALLRTIPPDITLLMRKRWQEVREVTDRGTYGPKGEQLRIGMQTASMLGRTSRVQLAAFGVPGCVIDQLIHVGLLQESGFGTVDFFHQRTFLFFLTEFHRFFPQAEATALIQTFVENGLSNSHFEQIFILHAIAGSVTPELTRRTTRLLSRIGISWEYHGPLLPALMGCLTRADQKLEDWVLRAYQIIGNAYQQLESLHAGCRALKEIYQSRVLPEPVEGLPGSDLASFLYELVNALLSVAEDKFALQVVDQAIAEISLADFASPKDKALAKARLIYRKQAVIKNFGRKEEAFELAQQVFSIAGQYGDRSLQIEALMDAASIRFMQEGPKAWDGLKYYQQALALFDGDLALPDPVPVRSFVARVWINLGKSDWTGAVACASEGIRYAESIRNHFWQARLRVLRTAALLAAAPDRECEGVAYEIHTTQDFMNTYAATRDLWATFYLLGKHHLLAGRVEASIDVFNSTIRTLLNGGNILERAERHAIVLKDIAVSCRAINSPRAATLFEPCRHTAVGLECLSILKADDALFAELVADWRRQVLICMEKPTGDLLTLVRL